MLSSNNTPPGREAKDYTNLTRSVAQSHARTEETKKDIVEKLNPLSAFLSKKWVSWIINYIKSRFWFSHSFNTYTDIKTDNGIYKLSSAEGKSVIKIALAADWGTNTLESEHIGREIAKHAPDYTIHMGDTYFVGAPFEIEDNFKPGASAWPYGAVGSFALTGNHEMYSNGNPYFDKLLPWMGLFQPERELQKASFFCLENDHWRVISLDTGYRSVGIPILEFFLSKANLRKEEIDWLENVVGIKNDNRGLIILTHHQYCSGFDKTYPSTAEQLARPSLIGKNREVLWFWGHEHRFAIYGKYAKPDGILAYGRCIGHGGMPTDIISSEKMDKDKDKIKESNLIVFDNRIRTQIDEENIGHNGYAMLSLENENLQVEYYDESNLLVQEKWIYNSSTQKIESKAIEIKCNELTSVQFINNAIS